jgi:hypothetical protein
MTTYRIASVDGKRSRVLDDAELKQMLSVALNNGWRPWSHRVRDGALHLDGTIDEIEAMELGAALERGLKRHGSSIAPALMVVIMETIGVLRYSAAHLSRQA